MVNRSIKELEDGTMRRAMWFLEWCETEGIPIIITCTYRSNEEQTAIYARGRTKPGRIVTYAKAGRSWHNARRAFDICFLKEKRASYKGPWKKVSDKAKSMGLTWGGDWPGKKRDKPHFQYEHDGDKGKKPLKYYMI